jgi:hypothetical protein
MKKKYVTLLICAVALVIVGCTFTQIANAQDGTIQSSLSMGQARGMVQSAVRSSIPNPTPDQQRAIDALVNEYASVFSAMGNRFHGQPISQESALAAAHSSANAGLSARIRAIAAWSGGRDPALEKERQEIRQKLEDEIKKLEEEHRKNVEREKQLEQEVEANLQEIKNAQAAALRAAEDAARTAAAAQDAQRAQEEELRRASERKWQEFQTDPELQFRLERAQANAQAWDAWQNNRSLSERVAAERTLGDKAGAVAGWIHEKMPSWKSFGINAGMSAVKVPPGVPVVSRLPLGLPAPGQIEKQVEMIGIQQRASQESGLAKRNDLLRALSETQGNFGPIPTR